MANVIEKKLDKEITSLLKKRRKQRPLFAVSVKSYSEFLNNKQAIIAVIREGVPYSLFKSISSISPFTENDWSVLLEMSTKSLQRYKQASRDFKPSQSERIIEVAEVMKKGMDTFGDLDRFTLWLKTTNYSLGKVKPLDLLKDSYGKDMVIGELNRIDHGVLS
jgi:putative toxin-antitoxin system antitoxin component (TIGR02293 family)